MTKEPIMLPLTRYRVYVDATGKRTTGNLDNELYFVGGIKYDGDKKGLKHTEVEKAVIEVRKSRKGYRDKLNSFYPSSYIHNFTFTMIPGQSLRFIADYYSFDDDIPDGFIRAKLKDKIMFYFD